MQHVEFAGLAMEAASATPIVLLRELDEPHRLLPIFIGGPEATGLEHGAFHATLALHGPGGALRLDTRPSDAIAIALRVVAQLYVADAILDEAGTTTDDTVQQPGTEPAEADIDQVITDFQTFLETVDPDDFDDFADAPPTD